LSSGIYCRVKQLSTDVSDVRAASIIPDDYFTQQYIPEDNSELQYKLLCCVILLSQTFIEIKSIESLKELYDKIIWIRTTYAVTQGLIAGWCGRQRGKSW
jgi:hypothetical protein